VLKPEGLSALTTFGVTWDPEDEHVTVHGVKIVRGGQTIDLLGKGKKMLVLRREQDLERARLDGRMSATQQIEGLQVGDILDISWTRTGAIPSPATAPTTWRAWASRAWPGATACSSLARRRRRSATAPPPASASPPSATGSAGPSSASTSRAPTPPSRRWRRAAAVPPLGFLETSGFESWNEISRMMAPLYARAATIDKASDLRAEIDAIAWPRAIPRNAPSPPCSWWRTRPATSSSGIGDGGYVPARADDTWARRFGDCKGKTALLLAIRTNWDVPGRARAGQPGAGDGMNERLPSLAAFNHVIVRAVSRQDLLAGRHPHRRQERPGRAAPAAAPLGPAGCAPPAPTSRRSTSRRWMRRRIEATLRFDASKGLDAPAACATTGLDPPEGRRRQSPSARWWPPRRAPTWSATSPADLGGMSWARWTRSSGGTTRTTITFEIALVRDRRPRLA
jgi:hypothetical protein